MITNKPSNKKLYKDRKKQQYLRRKKDAISKNNLNFDNIVEDDYFKKMLYKIINDLHIKSNLTNTFFCECCSPDVVNNELKKYGCNIIYNGCGKCYCCIRDFEDF
jgi:hypothetical protein